MSKKRFYLSSLTQKLILALAGLFLLLFLLVHMGINLFLLPITENHQQVFVEAAHFMGTNPVISIFEKVLFLTFIIHIIMGLIVQFQNWKARSHRYAVYGKSKTSFGSRYMIHTGIIIFLFLILHFVHFYFIKIGLTKPMEGALTAQQALHAHEHFYEIAKYLFENCLLYSIIYIVAFIGLAIHINHGFQSAFQTLGFNHDKYTLAIKVIGSIYALIICVGFTIIPLYFMFQ